MIQHGVLEVGDPFEQVPVVGDDQQRAGPRVQQVLHRREHVGVHVVGGFVQDQHVRLVEQGQQQVQPPLLTAGERADAHLLLGGRESELFEQLAGGDLVLPGPVGVPVATHDVADPLVEVVREALELLGDLLHGDGLAAPDPTGHGRERPLDQCEQGGLPGSVGAQDPHPVRGPDVHGDVLEHRHPVVAGGHVLEIDHVAAQSGGRQLGELDGVAHRGLPGDQLVGRVDPELRLRGARGGTALEPGQFLAHEVLSFGLDRCGLSVAFHALQDVGGVPALEGIDHTVVDLPHAGADRIQEPPVVRDHDQAAGACTPAGVQVSGEPRDALDVEMVGGLVQQQHVVVAHQQGRQVHPAELPTGQGVQVRLEVDVGEQSGHHVPDPGVGGPLVVRPVADHTGAHAHPGDDRVLLVEHAHPDPAPYRDPTGIDLPGACEGPQQRGLAVTVAADDADPVPVLDPERDRVEQHAIGQGDVDLLGSEQVGHGWMNSSRGWWRDGDGGRGVRRQGGQSDALDRPISRRPVRRAATGLAGPGRDRRVAPPAGTATTPVRRPTGAASRCRPVRCRRFQPDPYRPTVEGSGSRRTRPRPASLSTRVVMVPLVTRV
jgi:hypothetical protein